MRILIAYDQDWAGQDSTVNRGGWILDLIQHWGKAKYEAEPSSQAIALLQNQIDLILFLIHQYERFDLPAANRRVDTLDYYYFQAWDLMTDLIHQQVETAHSRAQTVDEYTTMLTIPTILAAKGQRVDFAALKERIDVTDYISRFTVLKPSAGKFVSRCPLPDHEDSTPSFWVYPSTKSWYCFGCQQGGDVIRFAQLLDGTTARDLAGTA